ncbi:alpha/beta hydrolase-fold protein [Chitinophaga nivalis]|uniref:Alpha/beta hydrolase-fold protein n=1 Tax=Chitinophaga nivalis TaxID=2991709 RepID=A0ABT3IFD2_9BACT|nr:alpha/beta hydrolase-fold protein [Chitinophaga nivalis]MCW3467657.1 alpha/beta hydrolase-fold protein [Chitinophaga nivalis]MCW3482651.1 alpha/beta hydrolase-fold protein [Chitinophaga nivalis]
MRSIFVVLLCSIFCLPLFAQQDTGKSLLIGNKQVLHSNILKEDRPYWVWLPESYNSKDYTPGKYPVMYLLDGDMNFHSASAIVQYLSRGMYAMIPEMIIIAIPNTDRTRDLTPTRFITTRPGKKGMLYETSGGGEQFVAFLERELIPHINKNYRTSGYQLLTGHSFGGLFTVNVCLKHNHLFNAYIALDPSLWWDNEKLNNEAASLLSAVAFKGSQLYVALANKVLLPQDTTTDHPRAIRRFTTSILPAAAESGLRWNWHYYEEDDHGTVALPGTYDGLKFIFKGYQSQVKQLVDAPELYTHQFEKLSLQNGFTFVPSEALTDGIGRYALSQEKLNSAIQLLSLNVRNYPMSAHAQQMLAQAYVRIGNKDKALAAYQAALTLAPKNQQIRKEIDALAAKK